MPEPFFIEDRRPTVDELEKFNLTAEQWRAALAQFQQGKMDLIRTAALARDRGISHRNPPFKVGCAVMGIEPNLDEGDYAVYYSSNFKPTPGEVRGNDKRCAERNALDGARGQAKLIVALVTVSKEVSTGDPTKAHDALHPCEDTIICNANDATEEIKTEERNLGDLLRLYADDLKPKER